MIQRLKIILKYSNLKKSRCFNTWKLDTPCNGLPFSYGRKCTRPHIDVQDNLEVNYCKDIQGRSKKKISTVAVSMVKIMTEAISMVKFSSQVFRVLNEKND